MGSSYQRGIKFSQDGWTVIAEEHDYKVIKQCNLYAQYYTIHCQTQTELHDFKDVLDIRRARNIPHAVQILGFSCKQMRGSCSNYYKLQIFTEHLPVLLSKEQRIGQQQAEQLCGHLLCSYSKLLEMVNLPFRIESNMAGYNIDGHLKVWFNHHFAKCYPSQPLKSNNAIQRKGGEHEMVLDIVQMVRKRHGKVPRLVKKVLGRIESPYLLQVVRQGLEMAQINKANQNIWTQTQM